MVLEATVLIADNSEYMRNADYSPSRIQAQSDAISFLFNAKTQSNPENTVGLLTMAGKSPSVMVTLTSDIGKILSAIHAISVNGSANINTSVQIAQLVLKHRQNKLQRQRIILFVASPVLEDEKTLVKLGKKLKKNSIAIDIVSFGENEQNEAKLAALIEATNSNDNCHLVSIPPGPHVLSDVLLSSPIVSGEDGPPPGLGSTAGYEFGVDPNLDPELALALRISMEEERARQENASGGPSESKASTTSQQSTDEDMLAQALAMSLNEGGGDVDMTSADDEAMARALAMSMEAETPAAAVDMSSVLGTLPGVDPNDPRIKKALAEEEEKKKNAKGPSGPSKK